MFTATFYHCAQLASSTICKFKQSAAYIVVVADKGCPAPCARKHISLMLVLATPAAIDTYSDFSGAVAFAFRQ